MILLSLLTGAMVPSDAEWSTDAAGKHHADLAPNGELDSLPFSKVECVMRWNGEHRRKSASPHNRQEHLSPFVDRHYGSGFCPWTVPREKRSSLFRLGAF